MAIQITNVNIVTDSFQNWVDKTNTLLYSYSTYSVTAAPNTAGSLTTGNAIVNGTFVSNNIVVNGTVNAGLRGGNLTTSNVLYIVSNVSIGNSSVNTSISNAGINTISIVATGNATIGGLASITGNATLSGSLQTISGNVNVDSGTLFVDATNNRVGINNTAPGVALHVTGQANITGNTTIGGVLNVTGNTSFTGNTDYTGAVVFSNTVAVTGNVNLSNTLTVTGNVNLSNTLTVTGNVTISNTANIVGAVALANTLAVAGNVSITGTGLHTVAGNVNFDSGTVLVDATNNRLGVNTASPSVALEVTGDTKITGVANVTANLQVGGDIIIAGNVVVSGSIGGGSSGVSSGGAAQTFNGNTTTVLIGNSTANGYILMGAKTSSFSNNDLVTYIANTGNTAIGGLANGTDYYVLTTNSTAIQLVNTVSNAAINLTSVPTSSQPGHFLVNPGAQVRGTLAAAANTTLLNLQVNRLATFANTVNAESITTRGFTQTGAGTFDVSGTAINFRNGQVFFNGGLKSLGDFEVTSGATAVTLAPAITANSSLTVNGAVSFLNKTLLTKSSTTTFTGNASSVLVGNSTVNGFIATSTTTLVNNDILTYSVATSNTVIGGLANNTDYYVITTNSTHIQLASTPGGAAIYLTSVAASPQSGHYLAPKLYNIRGSLGVTGNTTVGGAFIATGNTRLSNTLSVTGAATFSDTLSVTGAATFSNTLSATGAVTFSNTLSVTNTVTFSNTLLVTGAVTMSNNLTVNGTVTFNQPVTFSGGTGAQVTDITTSANLNANQIVVATGNIIANSTTLKIGNNTSGVITIGNTSFKTNTAISVNKTYAETTNSYGTSVNTLYNNVTLTGYAQHYANYTYAVANTLSANSTGGNPGNDLYGTVTIAKNANTEMGTENSRLSTLGAGFFEARNAAGGTTANTLTNAIGVYAVARSWGKGIITSATGVNSAVLVGNSTVTGNITTAYGVSSVVESNALGTIATGYLYYGSHNGSNTTNKFGIYLQGESNNYLSGMLNVVGNTVLGNNVTLGGNITVSGTSHALAGNVNIDSGTFYVDAVNNRVGVNNTAPTLALQVTGAANVSGNATVGSILTVSGNAAITGNTTVTGLTTLSGNATLSGALQTIAGNVNIDSGTLFVDSVNNRVGINNTAPTVGLQVTGTSNVTGAAAFANTINVTGAATLANTLLVTGAATFSNTVSVAGAITFSGALGAGNTTITGYANATGNLNANGLNIALGNITANSTTLIVGNATSGVIGIGNAAPSTYSLSLYKVQAGDASQGGNYNLIYNSNTSYTAARDLIGSYDLVFNNSQNKSSAGVAFASAVKATVGRVYNGNGSVSINSRTGTAHAGFFSTTNQANGSVANTIDQGYGVYGQVYTTSGGTIANGYGLFSSVGGSSTGNIGNAYGVYSSLEPGTSMTINNGYLVYGAYTNGSRVTTKYGVYLAGESLNYMSGALQVIGAVNTSTSFAVGAISASSTGALINSTSIAIGNSSVNAVINATSSKIHTYHVANATGMYSSGLANATLFQSSNATHTGSIGFASGVRIGTTTVNSSMTDVLISIANTTVSTSIAKEYILATNANTSVKSISVGGATLGGVGEIRATNNITAFATSDQQFKENVEEIKDAVTIVSQIGGKTFDWTDEYIDAHGGEDGYFVVKKDFGVIAQDVKKAFPLAVRTRADGTLAVDYEKLSALAFAAIIELKQEIEELKNGNKG